MIEEIAKRSNNLCEMCGSSDDVKPYFIENSKMGANLCKVCRDGASFKIEDSSHFHCLETAMWSEIPAIKILSYQILTALKNESFAKELLEILYIEDELKSYAKKPPIKKEPTLDSNLTELKDGDSVTIIKDLEVKGAGFTAKRGTVVKNITLTSDNTQIEGRVNGVRIVLVSKFLKKI